MGSDLEKLIKFLNDQEILFKEEMELNKRKEDTRQAILELCKKIQNVF